MKRLIAVDETHSGYWKPGSFVLNTTPATRAHERAEAEQGPSAPFEGWRALVTHRVMWNADVPELLPGIYRVY